MMFYYCPCSRKISKGQRFGLIARLKLRWRRNHVEDFINLKGEWVN